MTRLQIRTALNELRRREIEKKMIAEQKRRMILENNTRKVAKFCVLSESRYKKMGIYDRKTINENIFSDLFSSYSGGSIDALKQTVATFIVKKVFGEAAAKGLPGLIAANFAENLTMEKIKRIIAGDRVCEVISDTLLDAVLETLNEKYVIKMLIGDSADSDNLIVSSLASTFREMIANATNNTELVSNLKSAITGYICNMKFNLSSLGSFMSKGKDAASDLGNVATNALQVQGMV